MDPERRAKLKKGSQLTVAELQEGWHVCDADHYQVTQTDGVCLCGFDRSKVCGERGCNGFLCPWHCY